MSVCYGLQRPTADVDVLYLTPNQELVDLVAIAGKGSELARKYRLYIDLVTVATVPELYEERLQPVFTERFKQLHLFALDPYDLVLAKLERNQDVDRDDLRYLAKEVPLDTSTLRERYMRELRPFLGNPTREDLTLELWAEIIKEALSGLDLGGVPA